MASLSHRLAKKRFEKAAGVDLDAAIAAGVVQHRSPLQTVMDILRRKVGDDPDDPRMAGKLGDFFMNQYASQAALALLQYTKDSDQGIGFDTLRAQITGPSVVSNYRAAISAASSDQAANLQRAQNAKDRLGITTGDTLAPMTKVTSRATGGLAGMATAIQNSAAGRWAVMGAAGLGKLAGGVAGVGNAVVGILGPLWIAQGLFGKVLPLASKVAEGRLAGLALRALPALATGLRIAGVGVATFAAEATPAVLAFGAALALNPITWVVAGVAALAAGAFLLWRNWKPVPPGSAACGEASRPPLRARSGGSQPCLRGSSASAARCSAASLAGSAPWLEASRPVSSAWPPRWRPGPRRG